MSDKIIIFDSTLRDGNHAINHQLNKANIYDYCKGIDEAGVYTVIVGHGNGLCASSIQTGISLLTDDEMIQTAKKCLMKTKLGAFLIPGYGTISDGIKPAIVNGVELFCVASHCTEANITKQHIQYIRNADKEAYGVLMMCHMADVETLLIEARKMQEYGAMGVILMDSAGASLPEYVEKTITKLTDRLDIKIGFHPHNNLGLAIINGYLAIKSGASIIDGTLRGFGAGAGNCQLEALVALLIKEGYRLNVNLYKLLDVSEEIVAFFSKLDKGISAISIISGMTGVFSGFAPHVYKASKKYQVDPHDIFIELGKRKVVAGQEDTVIEIAYNLSKNRII